MHLEAALSEPVRWPRTEALASSICVVKPDELIGGQERDAVQAVLLLDLVQNDSLPAAKKHYLWHHCLFVAQIVERAVLSPAVEANGLCSYGVRAYQRPRGEDVRVGWRW